MRSTDEGPGGGDRPGPEEPTRARERLDRSTRVGHAKDSHAEQLAIAIDGGLGLQAAAAIAARPRGPAREIEAARWARRALASGNDQVAWVLLPGATSDDADAHAAFMYALEVERQRVAA